MDKRQIEKLLKSYFAGTKNPMGFRAKERILGASLHAFRINKQKQSLFVPFWKKPFSGKISYFAFGSVSLLVLFNALPIETSEVYSGEVKATNGTVEIVREGKTFLVRDVVKLEVGDVIRVGDKSEAVVTLPDQLESTLSPETSVQVLADNSLHLGSGKIKTKSYQNGEIITDKGFVKVSPGATSRVEISKTGEMKITSENTTLDAYDWKEGEILVYKGEEVRITNDIEKESSLPQFPSGEGISLAQQKAIDAKLIISRTKLLSALEKSLFDDKGGSREDFDSGVESFKSLLQTFDSSASISGGKRIDLDTVSVGDVLSFFQNRRTKESLFQEISAVATLINLLERTQGKLTFSPVDSGVRAFDRFYILDRLFSLASPPEQKAGDILKDKYVQSFVLRIQNEVSEEGKMTLLKKEIEKIPQDESGKNFLDRLFKALPENLRSAL